MLDSGINNNTLKVQNRKLILKLLLTGQCSSRIDIARETGLSKMATTNIINEFMDENIIEETQKQLVSGKGRNPMLLGLSEKAPKLIGIHICETSLEVSLCKLNLSTLETKRAELPKDPEKLIDSLIVLMDEFMSLTKGEKILGIGVGAAGSVDTDSGKIMFPPSIGIQDIYVMDRLEERYDLPVIFLSECDCAALTELYFGKGKDLQEFTFLGISKRVGSGIVAKGDLYRSSTGFNCEFGHTTIDYKGPLCYCGRRGCINAYTSVISLEEKLKEASGEDLVFEEFCKKYENNTPKEIDAIFEEMASMLAYGITNMATLTGNLNYIIGCEGYYIPDKYIKSCEKKTNDLVVLKDRRNVSIVKTAIHSSISSASCACAVLDRVLSRTGQYLAS